MNKKVVIENGKLLDNLHKANMLLYTHAYITSEEYLEIKKRITTNDRNE